MHFVQRVNQIITLCCTTRETRRLVHLVYRSRWTRWFMFVVIIYLYFSRFDCRRRGEKTWRTTETNRRSASTRAAFLSSSWARTTRPRRRWTAARACCCRRWRANGKNHVDGGHRRNNDCNRITSNRNSSTSTRRTTKGRTKERRPQRPTRGLKMRRWTRRWCRPVRPLLRTISRTREDVVFRRHAGSHPCRHTTNPRRLLRIRPPRHLNQNHHPWPSMLLRWLPSPLPTLYGHVP